MRLKQMAGIAGPHKDHRFLSIGREFPLAPEDPLVNQHDTMPEVQGSLCSPCSFLVFALLKLDALLSRLDRAHETGSRTRKSEASQELKKVYTVFVSFGVRFA